MKEKIYAILPNVFQNLLVSLYNLRAYNVRYSSKYSEYIRDITHNRTLSLSQLRECQRSRFDKFLQKATNSSKFFKDYPRVTIDEIRKLPIVSKEEMRQRINDIYTIPKSKGVVSKTGGTTGMSLEVVYTKDNLQERFAFLDDFRARFGYHLGKKTAWFSGKNLLTKKDVKKRRFWKTDYFYKVRYYSTFHIREQNLKFYVEDLMKFRPEYFVGFPSTIYEIAKFGLSNGYSYPSNSIKAIFPTAETITAEMREIIETFFNTKMYNQYASSEGAPFIFECTNGKLHLELQSGVFEILDENDNPASSGRLIVTSFTTEGTPLIRYDIGDRITLEDEINNCKCGNHNPLVKEILGRVDDYVYSPETGKINLGNVSNTLKDVWGIIRFQVIQNSLESINLLIVVDRDIYNDQMEQKFLQNWRDRVGERIQLHISYVDSIPVEKSGKFRIVKNNIKHLV